MTTLTHLNVSSELAYRLFDNFKTVAGREKNICKDTQDPHYTRKLSAKI